MQGNAFDEQGEVIIPDPEAPLPLDKHAALLQKLGYTDIDSFRFKNVADYVQQIDNRIARDEVRLIDIADGLAANKKLRIGKTVAVDPEFEFRDPKDDQNTLKLQYTPELPNEWEIGPNISPKGIPVFRIRSMSSGSIDSYYVPVDQLKPVPRTR